MYYSVIIILLFLLKLRKVFSIMLFQEYILSTALLLVHSYQIIKFLLFIGQI